MSEKKQHTAASLHNKMNHRYGDGLHHKHDKSHHLYRQHYRSHPVQSSFNFDETNKISASTRQLREFKLRKVRKRLDKGRIH